MPNDEDLQAARELAKTLNDQCVFTVAGRGVLTIAAVDFLADFRAQARAAGFRAGAEAQRTAILDAVSDPLDRVVIIGVPLAPFRPAPEEEPK